MLKQFNFPAILRTIRLTGTKQVFIGIVLATISLFSVQQASAIPLLLGTTSATGGGIGVYYNDSGPEDSATNLAFLVGAFAFDLNGTGNGAAFQFDNTDLLPAVPGEQSFNTTFSGLPVGSSQFGLDFVQEAATSDGSRTIPTLNAFDNTDGTAANADNAGPVDWAINDYKNGSPSGPGLAGNAIINSVLRGGNGDGSSIQLTSFTVSQSGSVFTANIAGQIISDGLTHWFNPAFGVGTLNGLGGLHLANAFDFNGVLTYDSSTDSPTNQVDFYQGSVSLFANSVPEPSTLMLLGLGLMGLRRRSRTTASR